MKEKTHQKETFDCLWNLFLNTSEGDFIKYDCDYLKHEFLQYLVDHRVAVLHGTQNREIGVLEPRKATGTGPNQALDI